MEDQRSFGGGISAMRRPGSRVAPISVTAALSIALLALALVWSVARGSSPQAYRAAAAQTAGTTSAPLALPDAPSPGAQATTSIAALGPAVVGELATEAATLQQEGAYTPQAASALAQQLGSSISASVPHRTYSLSDLRLGSDTSYAGMLAYRASLKEALAPLVSIKDPEIAAFAGYVETHDPRYLSQLRADAAAYAEAASSTALLAVPADAATDVIGVLNAMQEFGATLSALADNASDPLASSVLLVSYNNAESGMVSSFGALASYFARHSQP